MFERARSKHDGRLAPDESGGGLAEGHDGVALGSPLQPEERLALGCLLLTRALEQPGGPDRPTVRRVLGHALAAAGPGQAGVEGTRLAGTAEHLLGADGSARQRWEGLSQHRPELGSRLWADSGCLLVELGRLDRAEEALRRSGSGADTLDLSPGSGSSPGREASERSSLGWAALSRRRGNPGAARGRLATLLRRRPGWVPLLHELALAAWDEGDVDAAVAAFADVARAAPRSTAARVNWILALFAAGRPREAEVVLVGSRPSVRVDPEIRRWAGRTLQQPAPSSSPESAFSGRLDAISLSDLISLLGHSRSTGALVVRTGQRQGELRFREGKLIGADLRSGSKPESWLGRTPDPERRLLGALEVLLEWDEGSFSFEPRPRPEAAAGEIALETPVALLHACASLDARKRVGEP